MTPLEGGEQAERDGNLPLMAMFDFQAEVLAISRYISSGNRDILIS